MRGDESISSGEVHHREEKETEIWKVCKLCPKGEISMSTFNRKLNWLPKKSAQLRKNLRLKQKWTKEIGNKKKN